MMLFENNKAILKLPKKLEHNSIYEINIINEPFQYLIIDFYKKSLCQFFDKIQGENELSIYC